MPEPQNEFEIDAPDLPMHEPDENESRPMDAEEIMELKRKKEKAIQEAELRKMS